jgi:hypothetical protein
VSRLVDHDGRKTHSRLLFSQVAIKMIRVATKQQVSIERIKKVRWLRTFGVYSTLTEYFL